MSFTNEKAIKATRKDHRCIGCEHIIPAGSAAIRWSGMTDGDFSSVVYHTDCRAAEIDLNNAYDTRGDEWMGLHEMEWEDWPWLLESYPAIAERRGVTMEKYREAEAHRARCRAAFAKPATTPDQTKGDE